MENERLSGRVTQFTVPLLCLIIVILPFFGAVVINKAIGAISGYIALGFGLLLVAILIINLIAVAVLYSRGINLRKSREKVLSQKEQLLANYKRYFNRVKLLKLFIRFYYGFFYLCLFVINSYLFYKIGVGQKAVELALLIIATAVLMVFEFAFFGKCVLRPIEIPPDLTLKITKEQYPYLFGIVDEASNDAGMIAGFVNYLNILIIPGCNAGVAKNKDGGDELVIGLDLLALCKPDELKTVLKHEFAHIKNFDTAISYKLRRMGKKLAYLSGRGFLFPSFMFFPLSVAANYRFEMFMFINSYNLEMRADSNFNSVNEKQSAVNAFAKLDLFNLHTVFTEPNQELYSAKEYPDDIIEYNHNYFKECYLANKAEWEDICLHQLPAKIDTHPTLVERMKSLNINSFEVDFTNGDEKLKSEIEDIRKKYGEYFKNSINWDEQVEYNRTIPQKRIEEFENARQNAPENFSYDPLEVAGHYFTVGQFDKAAAYYKETLEKNPENADALFNYGFILSLRRDDKCVDYLVRAMESFTYTERAMVRINDYMTFSSSEELRDKFRDEIVAKSAEYIRFVSTGRLFKKKHTLTPESYEKLKNCIWKNPDVRSAVIFSKKVRSRTVNFLLLNLDASTPAIKVNEAFTVLLRLTSNFSKEILLSAASDKSYFKLLNKKHLVIKR